MLHDSLGVRAIAICDFEIWPDAEQKKQNLPLVPMLSRWNMREHGSGNHGLMQVQYAFLELPKLPEQRPRPRARPCGPGSSCTRSSSRRVSVRYSEPAGGFPP